MVEREEGVLMAQTLKDQTEPTLVKWDDLPEQVQDNLLRQHREGGILSITLPMARTQRKLAMEPWNDAVKEARTTVERIDKDLMKPGNKAVDFRRLVKEKQAAIVELEAAEAARKEFREGNEHVKKVIDLGVHLRASRWIRTGQVVNVLGDLTDQILTETDQAESAAYKAWKTKQNMLQSMFGL